MRDVILTQGVWVPGAVMLPLAARLERAGYRCRTFSYMGAGEPLEAHAESLARFARRIGPAHFVAHSMGGLVVLEALSRLPELAAGRVGFAGRRIARYSAGRWFLGQSEVLWREGRASRWTRPEALGVVAGSLPLGLGRLFGRLPGVNDGVVSLEETEVEGMAERAVLPVGHSAMLLSSRVAAHIAQFLTDGKFAAPTR